jgi:hypothetical protein
VPEPVGADRLAEQALHVRQRDRAGFVPPFVAVTQNLTPQEYVLEVVDKAGITRPPYFWMRYDCATWLADTPAAQLDRLEAYYGINTRTTSSPASRAKPSRTTGCRPR